MEKLKIKYQSLSRAAARDDNAKFKNNLRITTYNS